MPSAAPAAVTPPARPVRRLSFFLLIALAYVVTGKLGLMLALPPGYASPVFPPAGIAIAAAFIGGTRSLPWTFVASLALNLWVGSETGAAGGMALATAVAIAVGSTAQAAVGGFALRRAIGYPAGFDDARQILRFMLLAPLVCLTSATLSVGALLALGIFAPASFAVQWASWWVGDTLGVVLMLPLALVVAAEPRTLWRRRAASMALPMVLTFALFVAIFLRTSKWEWENALVGFRVQSEQAVIHIQTHLDQQAFLLEQLRGLFLHDDKGRVERAEFERFVAPSLTRFPMVQALEWAPRVEVDRRAGFEAAGRREFPGFAIVERDPAGKLASAGRRAAYYPVAFIEPLAGNQAAVGFDVASTPERRAALENAVATGVLVATPAVHLVQNAGAVGILLLLPVKTGAENRGVVLSVLRIDRFVDKVLESTKASLQVRLLDRDDGRILYDKFSQSGANVLFERDFAFGTRHYRLQAAPTPAYLQAHRGWQSWAVLAVGILGTGLLGALLLLSTGHAAHVEAEVRRKTRELAESEAKLEEVTITLAEGVYVLDERGLITFTNPEAQRLLGWQRDELAGRDAHELFHARRPDGSPIPRKECGVSGVLASGQILRSDDEVFWRRDGTSFPVSVTAAPIRRDGAIVGAVVAFADIAQRKRDEQRLQESEERFRLISTSAMDAIVIIGGDETITYWNPAAEKVFGYPATEALGRNLHAMLAPPRFRPRVAGGFARFATSGQGPLIGTTFETYALNKNGEEFPIELSISAFRIQDRWHAMGIIRDISGRKRTEAALREGEERYRLLFNSGNDAIFVHPMLPDGRPGVFVEVNEVACRRLGYCRDELLAMSPADIDAPDSTTAPGQVLERLHGQGFAIFEQVHVARDGRRIPVEISTHAFTMGGEPLVMSVVRDISERKKAEHEYRTILQTAMDGFVVMDAEGGRFLDVNDAYCAMLGYRRDELLHMGVLEIDAVQSPDELAARRAELRTTGRLRFETRHRRKDGSVVDVDVSATYMEIRGGAMIAFVRDITERKRAEAQVRQLAYFDTLTELPNRRLLLDRLNLALVQAKRYSRALAVLFLDLDRFKSINDTLGHDVGDELLRVVAARLAAAVRIGDTVCRQGGDEFVIVLDEIAHPQDAAHVAEKIIATLTQPIDAKGHQLCVTTSIGISIYPVDGTDDAQELMKKADIAMYAAKEGGRNRYRFYEQPSRTPEPG